MWWVLKRTVSISTQNICLNWWIRKKSQFYAEIFAYLHLCTVIFLCFSLKVSYSPGKKGGNYGLPLGAKLIVPDGVFAKKDSITCQVAAPTQRWKYTPALQPSEHLTSEIFMLSSTLNLLKKAIVVQVSYLSYTYSIRTIGWKRRQHFSIAVCHLTKMYNCANALNRQRQRAIH